MGSTPRKLMLLWLLLILTATAAAHGADDTIRWMDYAAGKALARSQGKKAIVYFHAAWCASCKQMEAETFPHPEVIRLLNETFIAIRVDVDQQRDVAAAYGVTGVPDLWLIHPDATAIGNVIGFVPASRLLKILEFQRR